MKHSVEASSSFTKFVSAYMSLTEAYQFMAFIRPRQVVLDDAESSTNRGCEIGPLSVSTMQSDSHSKSRPV